MCVRNIAKGGQWERVEARGGARFSPEPSSTHPTRCCQHTLVYKKKSHGGFCLAHQWTSLYTIALVTTPSIGTSMSSFGERGINLLVLALRRRGHGHEMGLFQGIPKELTCFLLRFPIPFRHFCAHVVSFTLPKV